MKRYGLIFKLINRCWLAEYVDGSVQDASPIDDHDGVYSELALHEMSLVEITGDGSVDGGEQVTLQDIKTIRVRNDSDPDATIGDLIESQKFPKVAESVYQEEIGYLGSI